MIKLNFQPESSEIKLTKATEEYKKIWKKDGEIIIQAMEKNSELKFTEPVIKVIIWEGFSVNELNHIKLRASYGLKNKKSVLIHELGHRLLFWLNTLEELNPHQVLYLILYDIWEELYGKDFANNQVLFEKNIIDKNDNYRYKNDWEWALSMSKEERIKKFQKLIQKHIPVVENMDKTIAQ